MLFCFDRGNRRNIIARIHPIRLLRSGRFTVAFRDKILKSYLFRPVPV